ncbi:hypothetical protein GCM10010967_56090 [Dyadobacter beijingensis]|uniref:Calcineurin-like phosphoesterase domain-containing protein n=1 Tax=Dyadobacter beijingensis TaxID=365489 RepID=A0ABQ2IIG7_9BACT|nr:hypothetical protein GCM10010967_56090 [Dyadobacter beijingensis]
METHRPDAIYCLGDLVGCNVWPNEVIDEIRKRHIPTITGNYDFGIGRGSDDSVGKPKDQDPRGGGVLLTLNEHSSLQAPDSIEVALIRFEYDVEEAARAIENSPLPNAYADMLRNG